MLQPYFNFNTFKRRSSSRGGLETLAGRLSGNLAKRFRSAKQCVDISAVHGMGFDKDLKKKHGKHLGHHRFEYLTLLVLLFFFLLPMIVHAEVNNQPCKVFTGAEGPNAFRSIKFLGCWQKIVSFQHNRLTFLVH